MILRRKLQKTCLKIEKVPPPQGGETYFDLELSMNYTYLLRCGDGSLYCGWTNDLEERLAAHQSGKGAKYTRAHQPVELVYYEQFGTKAEAMRREAEIKRYSRSQKLALIQQSIPSAPSPRP